MAAARSPCGGFKTRVLHFKLRYTVKRQKMYRGSSKNAQFSFCGGREAFHQEIVLRGIQTCFLHGEAGGLGFEMQPARRRSFCRTLRYILHPVAKKISFFKRNLYVYKRFIYVSYIFSSALQKTYKMRPAQPILLA